MTDLPPDEWTPEQWGAAGINIPPERHELNQAYLDFLRWLLVTGRLTGDTAPRPRWPFDGLIP